MRSYIIYKPLTCFAHNHFIRMLRTLSKECRLYNTVDNACTEGDPLKHSLLTLAFSDLTRLFTTSTLFYYVLFRKQVIIKIYFYLNRL